MFVSFVNHRSSKCGKLMDDSGVQKAEDLQRSSVRQWNSLLSIARTP